MSTSTHKIVGASAAAAALAVAGISAAGVRDWMDTFGKFIQHPAAVSIMVILVAILMTWLFVRAAESNAECEKRDQVKATQLQAIYILLSSDRRYAERLPSAEDWNNGRMNIQEMVRASRGQAERS